MDKTKDWFGYDSLAFFGKVNASISHELKNVMAIISETSGLLSDLSDLASTGKPIAPEMLKSCTGSIIEEIQRGFAIIRQMNRFSHSVDSPVQSVNLLDTLEMVIALSEYLNFSAKTRLRPDQGDAPVVLTCPFLLQAVVYQTLVFAYKHTGPEAEIAIFIQPLDDSGWRIIFPGFDVNMFQVFPDAATIAMAQSIGIAIRCDSATDQVEMDIPLSLENITAHDVSPEIPDTAKPSQTRA
jgi:signal transduction histidine kinase